MTKLLEPEAMAALVALVEGAAIAAVLILGVLSMSRTTPRALTPIARPDVRAYQPTTDETRWVATWEEFRAAGGVICFAEDQAEVALQLPEGVKFSCRFMRS